MSEETPRSIDGYPVVKELGSGASGVVFQVRLPGRQKFAALKLFRGEIDSADALRFRREFGALARCRHEGIVSVYGIGEHDRRPYILMEYVKGLPMDIAFREGLRQNEPLPLARQKRLANAVRQILDTLKYLHSNRIVHRDIKPANIFVGDDDKLKLLDFGLAWHGQPFSRESPAGTAGYQAPEQILGQGTDPRSDLYSLGVTLYQIIAGVHPFGSFSDWQTLLERQLNSRYNRLSVMNPAFGEYWEFLVGKLMAPDPVERFYSAGQAIVDLGRIVPSIPIEVDSQNGGVDSWGILQTLWTGDTKPVDQILQWIMAPERIHGFFQVPSGGGRTRFLEEIQIRTQDERIILKFDCNQDSTESWLGRLIKAFIPANGLESLSLNTEYRTIDSFLDHQKQMDQEKPEKTRDAFIHALKKILRQSVPARSVLLLIDNAENLSELAVRTLLVLMEIDWIGVVMSGDHLPERIMRRVSTQLWQPASDHDVATLIRRVLGDENVVSEKVAGAIGQIAANKLGLVMQYLQAWIRAGQLTRESGVWSLHPPAATKPALLHLDESAACILTAPSPTRCLPESDRLDREILRTVAACSVPCRFSLLTKLFAARETLLLEVLDRLIRNGWLLETSENGEIFYQFEQLRDKNDVYQRMSSAHRRYLHRRIWEVIRKQPGIDHHEIFTHVNFSEDPIDGLDQLELIARAARDRFDNDNALRYYSSLGEIVTRSFRDSADVTSGPEDWVVRIGGASYSMMLDGARNSRALQLSEKLKINIDVSRNRGNIFGRTGDYGAAFDSFHHMLALARDIQDRRSEGDALRFIGQILFYQRKLEESGKYFRESLVIRQEIDDRAGIADCMNALGVLAQQTQQFDDALEFFSQSMKLKSALGDERGTVYIRNNIANLYYNRQNYADALVEFRASCEVFKRLGDELGLAYCLYNIGGVCIELGDYADAITVLEESLAIRRKMHDLQDIGHCLWQLATALKGVGRNEEAVHNLEEAIVTLEEVNLTEDARDCRLLMEEISGRITLADAN